MTQTQQTGDNEAESPIHRDKEKTGEQDHEKNKHRRDHGLLARGPSHFGGFSAHLLKEFQRIGHCRGESSRCSCAILEVLLWNSSRFKAVPRPVISSLRSQQTENGAAKKNQGAEPEGHAPQLIFIIKDERNANPFLLFERQRLSRRCEPRLA